MRWRGAESLGYSPPAIRKILFPFSLQVVFASPYDRPHLPKGKFSFLLLNSSRLSYFRLCLVDASPSNYYFAIHFASVILSRIPPTWLSDSEEHIYTSAELLFVITGSEVRLPLIAPPFEIPAEISNFLTWRKEGAHLIMILFHFPELLWPLLAGTIISKVCPQLFSSREKVKIKRDQSLPVPARGNPSSISFPPP